MCRLLIAVLALAFAGQATADETFVTIHQVRGRQLAVTEDSGGRSAQTSIDDFESTGRPRGRRGRGRGMTATPMVLTVPSNAKITSALRERRTFEFRVGVELAGGLQHPVFREMTKPLSGRIVTDDRKRIVEVNVITPDSDLNQTNTSATGEMVIAVRPKRPPMKRTP